MLTRKVDPDAFTRSYKQIAVGIYLKTYTF
jgi:hypothetical protein